MTLSRLVPAFLVMASMASAQSTMVVDEGTLAVTRGGVSLGTEAFKIVRRQGAEGVEFVAQCTWTVPGRVVKTALTVDSGGSPTSYSRTASGSSPGQLTVRRAPGRLTVDETGDRASTKDYLFEAGSLILDEDLHHQLYFVTLKVSTAPIAYVAPGSRASGRGAVVDLGPETLTIGKQSVQATHFAFGIGAARRDIWIDSKRRLLKVSVPSQRIEAVRELSPP
jgi:hypothetical protein